MTETVLEIHQYDERDVQEGTKFTIQGQYYRVRWFEWIQIWKWGKLREKAQRLQQFKVTKVYGGNSSLSISPSCYAYEEL